MNHHPNAAPDRDVRIALLIDADNSPATKIDVILAELAKFGVANIRRAYGNWKKNELKGWEQVLHEYAIRPIQQFDHSKGKNATDMVMCIEAMDLLYTDRPDAFGLVSSDADFTPLVLHLRAKGATVYGFGAKKTPMPFVNACSRFLYLESLGQSPEAVLSAPRAAAMPAGDKPAGKSAGKTAAKTSRGRKTAKPANGAPAEPVVVAAEVAVVEAAAPGSGAQPTHVLKQDARLVSLLRNAVEAATGDDGWSPLREVGQHIANQASFDPRNHGYRKLVDLIEATQLFEMDRRGTSIVLRDKRAGRAARPAG